VELMPTNDRDIQALTYLATRLRTETMGAGEWDQAGTHAVISRFKSHNLAVTIERVTRHAADTEARTPGAMERPFVPAPPVAGPRTNAKAGDPDECRRHVGEHVGTCRPCAVDHIPHPEDPADGHTEAGRALLEEIRKRRSGAQADSTPEGDQA
jgi:hypothetical protein